MRFPAPLFGLWFAVTASVSAQAADAKARQAAVGLDAEVRATWTRLPLRDWVDRAATMAGMPVVLDRRLDPQLPVTLDADGRPLRDVIATVATAASAAVDELAGSVRIVPTANAGRARKADRDRAARIAALPITVRRTVSQRRPWRWPAGARPRDLVVAAATEAGVEIAGIDSIPHDHFPAADLPALSLAERVDLVLAHFDQRVVWEARSGKAVGRIVAIDADVADVPDAVADAAADDKPRPRPGRRTVTVRDEFTLRLEAPLDQALAAISGRLGLTLELDQAGLAARGIAPGEIVRATVEKASREELLDALVHPIGLAWKIEGQRLRVFPAPPTP